MKIVYCIAGMYRPGGMERVLTNKANYLVNVGYEVHIITTDQRQQAPYFPLDERVKCYDLEIDYEENNGKPIWNKLAYYPFKQYRHKQRLRKLLEKLKPDIVVSMFCNDVSFITRINDGSKKVLEVHFSKFKRLQYARRGLWRLADVWRTKQDTKHAALFDKFVVLTQEDKSYWGKLPNIHVIPNAIPLTPDLTSALVEKKVIAIGRYTYQKGFDRLIDIWNEVCKKEAQWQLEIVGEGELRASLQKRIDDYGIAHRVRLSEPTSEIYCRYLKSSILVLTSRYEGLPMILLEAQAFGLPIVSFQCKCGPKDVVTDGVDGFLIPEGDKKQFADRLIALMNDYDLRKQMGIAAKKASERYAEERIMMQWTQLFESLVK